MGRCAGQQPLTAFPAPADSCSAGAYGGWGYFKATWQASSFWGGGRPQIHHAAASRDSSALATGGGLPANGDRASCCVCPQQPETSQ